MVILFKLQRQLQLLPPTGRLQFMTIDVLGSLPRAKSGKQRFIIITDRYSKRVRAILTLNILLMHVAYIFRNYYVSVL